MSSQLTSLVTLFDGSNWGIWSRAMKAFLMSQGLWGYVNGTITMPVITADPNIAAQVADHTAQQAALTAWNKADDQALGSIVLRLKPELQQHVTQATAATVWDALEQRYGAATVPSIYKDFKEAISIRINPNQHPAAQFDKLSAAFARLGAVTFGTGANATNLSIKNQLQALIGLAALPAKWEHLVPILCQSTLLDNLKLSDVATAAISQFETETNRGQHKGTVHSASKISSVKQKRGGNPSFNQQGRSQQQSGPSSSFNPSSNQQQKPRQRGGRGQRGRGGKGKGLPRPQGHSHVASVASLVAPTTHHISHVGPSGIVTCTSHETSPIKEGSGFYPSVNKAVSLAQRLEVPATVQMVKTLEQRLSDFNAEIRPRIDAFMDEESDSDFDVDMSQEVVSRGEGLQTETDPEDWTSELSNALGLYFDELTVVDGDSDKENRAPTPYSVASAPLERTDSQLSIERMWASFTTNPNWGIRRTSSNEDVEITWNRRQEYLRLQQEVGYAPMSPRSRAPTPEGSGITIPVDDITMRDIPSRSTSPLDWGSDDEEYVSHTLCAASTEQHAVLAHSRNVPGGCGNCNNTVAAMSEEVAHMYNMNIGALDLLLCEHNKYLSQCAKCKERMNTMWLLDSGASAHFTNLMSDFISYTPFAKSDRIPVKTASNFILVEGIGTVLLKHYLGRKLVTTRVHPVLYIPDMTTRLLSMGEFLQQGMRVNGDSNQISLWDQIHLFIQCKPLITGQTLYWLDATSIMVETQSADSATIYKVDYDLMHRRLGHPSKEVLRRAKDHTKGFPDGILIPTNEGLCPGCAQGKMPAASHPKSDTRATAPFKRIHSDLKSFPLPSYHKYKYFIVFLDDYTSHAWITLLCNKVSAITALEQWLVLIKNQYDTTIKE